MYDAEGGCRWGGSSAPMQVSPGSATCVERENIYTFYVFVLRTEER